MPGLSSNSASAVSWGAILAGAAAAAALSFILMILGFGFGLLSVSPWSGEGVSAEAIGFGTIIWLIIIHLAASGLGGYLAGRLRIKWPDVHNDEVYFRDTAHGLVTWSVSTIFAIALMGGGAAAIMSGGAKAASGLASQGGDIIENVMDEQDYYARQVLRSDNWDEDANQGRIDEVTGILVRTLQDGEMSDGDRDYLIDLVEGRTNLSRANATQRVDTIISDAEAYYELALEAVDDARQAAAWTAIWMFVALLAGAFFAALMATFGGRQRDEVLGPHI